MPHNVRLGDYVRALEVGEGRAEEAFGEAADAHTIRGEVVGIEHPAILLIRTPEGQKRCYLEGAERIAKPAFTLRLRWNPNRGNRGYEVTCPERPTLPRSTGKYANETIGHFLRHNGDALGVEIIPE